MFVENQISIGVFYAALEECTRSKSTVTLRANVTRKNISIYGHYKPQQMLWQNEPLGSTCAEAWTSSCVSVFHGQRGELSILLTKHLSNFAQV
eukprot:2165887-Ditylum_brightwellii.AAC.1